MITRFVFCENQIVEVPCWIWKSAALMLRLLMSTLALPAR